MSMGGVGLYGGESGDTGLYGGESGGLYGGELGDTGLYGGELGATGLYGGKVNGVVYGFVTGGSHIVGSGGCEVDGFVTGGCAVGTRRTNAAHMDGSHMEVEVSCTNSRGEVHNVMGLVLVSYASANTCTFPNMMSRHNAQMVSPWLVRMSPNNWNSRFLVPFKHTFDSSRMAFACPCHPSSRGVFPFGSTRPINTSPTLGLSRVTGTQMGPNRAGFLDRLDC